jgi:predicted nucleic acid-binding protein
LAGPEQRFFSDAKKLLLDAERPLAALDLTHLEIANAVGVKMRQPERALRLSEIVAVRCGDRLSRVDPELIAAALELASEHDLTVYDAAYVAVAQRRAWTLVSADLRDLVSKGLAVAPDAALYP